MKTALIISEYNPFHEGHKYQINDIRREFGDNTAVISLMSGNYTQRGEIAIADKFTRAECAVREGVNLVLHLPFPFSTSSAEFFATAGVEIANAIGVVDILAFGSECGDIDLLINVAKNMTTNLFINELSGAINDDEQKNLGYPKLCEKTYNRLFSDKISSEFFTSNNILAIEYIKALIKTNSTIKPYTTKRLGAGYNTDYIVNKEFQSASAIRNEFWKDLSSALNFIPNNSKNTLSSAIARGDMPCDTERLSSAVLSFFCLNSPSASYSIHDADGGLYNRLKTASLKATSISTLTKLASTKKYTTARIKRAIWYSFFGVTSSDVRTKPHYTQVLAMDHVGQALLKRIKKTTSFPIITKPSSTEGLDDIALRQKQLSDSADFLFELSKPIPSPAEKVFKATPFVKKEEKMR